MKATKIVRNIMRKHMDIIYTNKVADPAQRTVKCYRPSSPAIEKRMIADIRNALRDVRYSIRTSHSITGWNPGAIIVQVPFE